MGSTLLHKRSSVVQGNQPKLPTPSQVDYGEIAINFAAGHETLSIKNNNNVLVPFSSDAQIEAKIDARLSGVTMNGTALTVSGGVVDLGNVMTDSEERVISASLNDLNDRLNAVTGDVQNTVTSVTLNGSALTVSGGVVDLGNLMDEDDDYVIAQSLNDLNNRVDAVSGSAQNAITGVSVNGTALTVSGGVVGFENISSIIINGEEATNNGGVVDLGSFISQSKELIISSSLNDLNTRLIELSASTSGKQETLISGTNIKTVNGESLLGSGDITIEAGDIYTAGTGIDITNDVISVTGKQDTLVSGTNIKTINGTDILGSGNITIQTGSSYNAGSGIAISNNTISVTGKQETLVSGTNIKTINGNSLLGSGNIVIQGGSTGGSVEYSAGTNIDITNYVISVTGLNSYEVTANKATTITSASTHTEYASAKAVYDFVGDIDAALNIILTGTTS